MNKKVCLITGGNSGIGKQAAIQLAKLNFHVLIGVRNRKRGEIACSEIKEKSGNEHVEILEMDMSSKQSIIKASKVIHEQIDKLDVLIHNAADFDIARKQTEKSVDGIETIWATNHVGPVFLTNAVMDLIKKSDQGRIITIASQGLVMYPNLTVDISDPEFKNRKFSVPKAYYQSKLAQVMYTYWLSEQLIKTAITVNCLRVTNVKVDTGRYPNISVFKKFLYKLKSSFSISPEEMARTYTYLATSLELQKVSGKYFNEKNKSVSSSSYSIKKENIENVMQLTMRYL